ncbi:non-ribosomal peptide synthetase [Nocardia carnea]|uniref:Amino acid adenylation domain-containing protein n=1 Tax=Nocardia carnea TaxID=37328 RepID=A0ABW7TGI8_9NOCA|nr:non-ribosomal peptide synthetase [Nocardia carnea]
MDDDSVFPLSPGQLGVWFAQQSAADVPFVVAQYVEVRGELDPGLLDTACRRAGREIGSAFVRIVEIGGQPWQHVAETAEAGLALVDLRAEADPESAAHAWMRRDFEMPRQLAGTQLVHSAVLRLDEYRWYWYARAHHVVLDGLGALNFLLRVAEIYRAAVSGHRPPPYRAGSPAELYDEEIAYLGSPRHDRDREYWRKRTLGLADSVLSERYTRHPAHPVVAAAAAGPGTAGALRAAAQRHGCSVATLAVAAVALFCARILDRTDIVLTLPVSGRTSAMAKRSGGMLANLVPLRIEVLPESDIADLVTRTQWAITGALRHQRYRHENIRSDAGRTSAAGGQFGPIVNIMLFEDTIRLGGASGRLRVLTSGPIDDLLINLYTEGHEDGLRADFQGNPHSYTETELAANRRLFLRVLDELAVAAETTPLADIELLDDAERTALCRDRNTTGHPVTATTLAARFVARVRSTPEAPALRDGARSWTYARFHSEVNRRARFLIGLGVGPEVRVAVALQRSADQLCWLYAVTVAGGAYVPVDPEHPRLRIAHMLRSARPSVLLTVDGEDLGVPAQTTVVAVAEVDATAWDDAEIDDDDRIAPLRPGHAASVLFTSGSTGLPKGVVTTHAAIDHQFQWAQHEYGLGDSDVVLYKTPLTFDIAMWEVFWPLQAGACVAVAAPDAHRDLAELDRAITDYGVTTLHLVPTVLANYLATAPAPATSVRRVFAAGEELPAALVTEFEKWTAAALFNWYGPAEAQVVTAARIHSSTGVSIGAPVWNMRVHVLDSRLRPVPVGVRGELYVGGAQVARGYVSGAEATASRFVADPFGAAGARLYRTGDAVRWNTAGVLEYLGRTDRQVKLHGVRIELDEIAAGLRACQGIVRAAAAVREVAGERRLVGYVVTAAGATVESGELLRDLARRLPRAMVPVAVVVLPELPVNANGKLDREALPEPPVPGSAYEEPAGITEQLIASCFADILGVQDVGRADDFFALGANSMDAAQLAARLAGALRIAVSVREIFDAPTVAELAEVVSGRPVTDGARIGQGPRPDRLPLSPAQQRMWLRNQADPEAPVDNMAAAVRISGSLDIAALRTALGDIVGRHESLRTRYPVVDGSPAQLICAPDAAAVLADPITVPAADLDREIIAMARRGFDVSAEIPLRAALFALGPGEHVLAYVVHHISADGWSARPFIADLMTAYAARARGVEPEWQPLPAQFAEAARWQSDRLGAPADPRSLRARQSRFWQETLAGVPEELPLPVDRPRSSASSWEGGRWRFVVDADLAAGLTALARTRQATLFMAAHAVFAVLLARMTDSDDICVGTPVAGRPMAEFDGLVGMFVNTLTLRSVIDGDRGFADILTDVRRIDLAAFEHADLPFEEVVQVLARPAGSGRHPLFRVAFSFENQPTGELQFPGLTVRSLDIDPGVARFDLALTMRPAVDAKGRAQLEAEFSYARDLFDEETIRFWAASWLRLAAVVVAHPRTPVGDIDFHETRPGGPSVSESAGRTLGDILTAALPWARDRIAVVDGDREIGYDELDTWSGRLAGQLIARGIGPGDVVVIHAPRSAEFLAGVWAVAKSGAAFLPVDPAFPRDRVEWILADSGAVLGLTTGDPAGDGHGRLDWILLAPARQESGGTARFPTEPVSTRRPHPADLAYVQYTSGSTGRPKGVAVTHSGLGPLFETVTAQLGVEPGSRVLHVCAPTFDPSVLEWMLAFGNGATLVVVPPDTVGGAALDDLIATRNVTYAVTPPAILATLDPARHTGLRGLVVGGDISDPELVDRWAGDRIYLNGYGPTEVTVISVAAALAAGRPVLIGDATPGNAVRVLDRRLRPVPPGVVGELYLTGTGLARGYLRAPGRTAGSFVADPWSPTGARMYRTGDLVRYIRADRALSGLEYVGRTDFQLKIRGIRLEPGEVDAVLSRHETVRTSVTVGRTAPSGALMLVSYVVAAPGCSIDVVQLREFARGMLAAHSVPARIVALDRFPLTTAGKVDRAALPEPVFGAVAPAAPADAVERAVREVFAELLGVEVAGPEADFFELGGNSLAAARLGARLGAVFAAEVPMRTVFEAPTVAGLAARIRESAGSGARRVALVPERPARVPLAPAQQRLWFLNRFDPASAVNNIPIAVHIRGTLDIAALRAAIADVVARHEPLRTVYPEDVHGGPWQSVLRAGEQEIELSAVPVEPAELRERLATFAAMGFDLVRDLPVRVRLFRVHRHQHVLAVVIHHISADGWSARPLSTDLLTAYSARTAGAAPQFPAQPVAYADYAIRQVEWLGDAADPATPMGRQLAYWRERLAGLPARLPLPFDRPAPAVASGAGAALRVEFDPEVVAALGRMAVASGASRFMVVHAALAVTLARLTGGADIAIGTPVAGRGGAELDDLVGMFVNMVVLRIRVDLAASFADLLSAVRDTDLAAFAHADVPFERIVQELNPVRRRDHHPLFQVVLTEEVETRVVGTAAEITVQPVERDIRTAEFDLQLTLSDSAVYFTYATDLFDTATVRRIGDTLQRVLRAVTSATATPVGDIALLDDAEYARLVDPVQVEPGDDTTLADLFAAAVRLAPDAVAVRFGGIALTYQALATDSGALAQRLVRLGAGPEARVAVALPRGVRLIVAIVAVIRAGAAYVPIDPAYPPERIRYVLGETAPRCVLTTADSGIDAPAGVPVLELDRWENGEIEPLSTALPRARPGNLAYIIYTSGSTGRPKGVAVTHASIVALLRRAGALLGLNNDDVWSMVHSSAFDFSVWEMWGALTTGASLVVADHHTARSPRDLHELLSRERVSILNQTPSAFVALDAADAAADTPLALRRIVFGGEPLDPSSLLPLFRRYGGDAPRISNMFGITETTVHLTHAELDPVAAGRRAPGTPVGRPLDGVGIRVLDARLQPVPTGIVAEIYLAGAQVSRGYAERPGLTATRFVADPYTHGGVLYRSGDLGRWNESGELEHHGRADRQVQLRGFRIEPAEIEAALRTCPGVRAAAVIVDHDAGAGPRLLGYAAVGAADTAPADGHAAPADGHALRDVLRTQLPAHMVPDAVVVVAELPLTGTGKVDIAALPRPRFDSGRGYRAPSGELERRIAAVFADVLDVARVGADDSFFDLGGNSMVATTLLACLRDETGVDIALPWLFADPTPAGLARRIADARADSTLTPETALAPVLPIRTTGTGLPLFCIHPVMGLSWSFAGLGTEVACPLYGIQSPAITENTATPESIDDLAADYLRRIRAVQARGPYRLLGWCYGGLIAHAMAVQLQQQGERVELLGMLDSFAGDVGYLGEQPVTVGNLIGQLGTDQLVDIPAGEFTLDQAMQLLATLPGPFGALTEDRVQRVFTGVLSAQQIGPRHRPGIYRGDLIFFTADRDDRGSGRAAGAWRRYISGRVHETAVDATHWEIASPQSLRTIGRVLAPLLDAAPGTAGSRTERADMPSRPEDPVSLVS